MLLLTIFTRLIRANFTSPLIFTKKGTEDIVNIVFDKTYNVIDYSIMSASRKALTEEFVPIHRDTTQNGYLKEIIVPLNVIKKDTTKCFCVKVAVMINEKNEFLYSEPFVYDLKTNSWGLARLYEQTTWYDDNKYFVIGGFVILVALSIFLLYAYNSKEDTSSPL